MPALLRFAPSPTGQLHLGGLRMAMINQLVARKLGGKWILRIEDTDQKRIVPGSLKDIESSLEWAGLEYDYGPNKSGPHGPYFQSDRLDLYAHHAKSLLESGNAYRCFCSAERLTETRERLQHAGSHATYDRACLHLSEEEVARRVRAGEKHVVRVRVSPALGRKLDVNEMIFPRQFQPSTSRATDTILIKADSFPTYHFASVVDDHAMGISHVIRGEEWLPSLPLHAQLYDLLGWKPPNFAHIPILLNADGSKMSKRKGDAHVADFIRAGWEPEAVINWLAIAGWSSKAPSTPANPQGKGKSKGLPTDDTLTLPELEQKFDLSNVTHRRNILDKSKLESLNRQHLQKKILDPEGADSIVQRMLPKLHAQFPNK
ncbi:Glutamyl/glutaminyl-tRNA synthetase [Clavulina sp. PMI_390]|nr:Glutamyl/glutaminyl-tRNA synthetase [Clavulina sp. PMI_390]